MLKQELENLVGYEINEKEFEQLNKMYMACDLDKYEFAKLVRPTKNIKVKEVKLVFIAKGKTPNGCWYYGSWKRLVDLSIKTGKAIVENITEEDKTKLINDCQDFNYQYTFDFWDTQVEVIANL